MDPVDEFREVNKRVSQTVTKEDQGRKHIRITYSLIRDLRARKLDENLDQKLWEFMLQQRYKLYNALEGRLARFGGGLYVEGQEEIYEVTPPSNNEPQNWKEWNESKEAHRREKVVIEQKPSMGRVVLYNPLHASDDSDYPVPLCPAIIQHVNEDGSCNLFVLDFTGQHTDNYRTEGDNPGQWQWPPRV